MLYVFFFISELLVLFFLSVRVQKVLGSALFRLTKSKRLSVYILSLVFIPGTIIHELSHFLTALFLFVPVGGFEIIPEIEKDYVKLGSVKIAKADPLRRFLISVAPFLIGTGLILIITNLALANRLIVSKWIWVFIAYSVFAISNTMFMSNKDIEGVWGFLFLVLIIIVLVWISGINVNLNPLFSDKLENIISGASQLLLIPIVFDIITVSLLKKS